LCDCCEVGTVEDTTPAISFYFKFSIFASQWLIEIQKHLGKVVHGCHGVFPRYKKGTCNQWTSTNNLESSCFYCGCRAANPPVFSVFSPDFPRNFESSPQSHQILIALFEVWQLWWIKLCDWSSV
jgi:hypothetical protein